MTTLFIRYYFDTIKNNSVQSKALMRTAFINSRFFQFFTSKVQQVQFFEAINCVNNKSTLLLKYQRNLSVGMEILTRYILLVALSSQRRKPNIYMSETVSDTKRTSENKVQVEQILRSNRFHYRCLSKRKYLTRCHERENSFQPNI